MDKEIEKEKEKDLILENLKIVTEGIIKDFKPNNQFSSWKNTPIGLKFIKDDTFKFYMGVNLWIQITENQLIGTNDECIMQDMKCLHPWIANFLEIKKIVK